MGVGSRDAGGGFIGSEGFRDAFVTANEKADDVAMRNIRDDDNEAITAEGAWHAHLLPLIEVGLQRLHDAGIIDASRSSPTQRGPVHGCGRGPSKVLVETSPPTSAPSCWWSRTGGHHRPVVRWFDLITGLSLLLWALFTALAVWLSGRRARMIAWLSAGAIVALFAARLSPGPAGGGHAQEPELETKVVVNAVIEVAVDSLLGFTLALMSIALIVGAVALYLDWRESRTTREA